ncbi:MAG TPA: YciI family protein [Alphaproteobacteria bacterium]|nr:YciI family protein [Alphaproteobacteria bacterium]
MKRLFAVTNARSAAWNHALPMEEQEDWKAHAAFMDALQAEGFVVIGGPLEGTPEALLVIRANDAEEISSRLSEDPWRRKGLLTTTRIVPWTLRLGSLD